MRFLIYFCDLFLCPYVKEVRRNAFFIYLVRACVFFLPWEGVIGRESGIYVGNCSSFP